MTRRPIPLSLLTLAPAAIGLAGCAQDHAHHPSLLPRAVEMRDDLEPRHPAPAVVPDAALDATLASAEQTLAAATERFATAANKADKALSAGASAPVGSDPWLTAQNALTVLDSAQKQLADLTATLDQLAIDRAAHGLPPYPALEQLRARVDAQQADEAARLAKLHAALKPA